MIIPHHKLSYAQNFEDLVLSGILKKVGNGFYIDVGANHPERDSVTKIFYDRGWSGINIEPNDELHAKLVAERPRDINVKAAVGSQSGKLSIRVYEGLDGLSTISRELQSCYAAMRPEGSFRDCVVDAVCVAEVFETYRPSEPVHFMKIDVEGLELEVLLGNDWARFRPWVLCIERNLDAARLGGMNEFLRVHGYIAVFFDGLNDFFVAQERMDVWREFSYAGDVILNGIPVNHIFIKTISKLLAQSTS